MVDLVMALTLGAITGYQLVGVPAASASITELPFALIPTAGVPLLFVLHLTAVSKLARKRNTVLHPVASPSAAAA